MEKMGIRNTIYYDKGNESMIGGYLMASAAGSVKDPMDAYDINVIFY